MLSWIKNFTFLSGKPARHHCMSNHEYKILISGTPNKNIYQTLKVSFSGLKIYVQAQAFDSLKESLSSGVGRFCHMITLIKCHVTKRPVTKRLISNVAFQCWSLTMNFNSLSNSSFEGVILPDNN